MKRYIILLIGLFAVSTAYAQTIDDAVRLSQQDYEGTARFTSMGGAFGALGGDFTTLSVNPAGIGVYRSSEITITPTISYSKVTSNYMGENNSDSRTRFGLSNFGYIGTYLTGKENTGLIAMNFGIGYTKTMNFYKNTHMKGGYSLSSRMDAFEQKANYSPIGYMPDELEADDPYYYYYSPSEWDVVLAYNTGLIGYDGLEDLYYVNLGPNDRVIHERYNTQSGSTGEYVFSFGGNVSNKLYFGATLGVQDVYYENITNYYEDAIPGNVSTFKTFNYREYLETKGTGYNGKFGVIYRPIATLRLGAAIHTPTFYYLNDFYVASMNAQFTGNRYSFETPESVNPEYRLQSPFRAVGSVAYTFGKIGLLSIDYEFVNYKGIRMKDDYGEYTDIKQDSKKYLRNTSNIRIGGEAWFNNIALRAGFIYNQNPKTEEGYDDGIFGNLTDARYTYSFGIGYKYKAFALDLAYSLMNTQETNYPYYAYNNSGVNMAREVTEKENKSRFMATFGFRF